MPWRQGPDEADFVKERPSAPPGFFEFEAAGLRWLAEAEPAGGPPVVGVREVCPGRIVLDRLRPAAPSAAAAERLGRQLAALHASGADAFGALPRGWAGPAYIGRQRLPGGTRASWGTFFAELRLSPFVESAVRAGNLGPAGRRAVERVCARLAAGDFDDGRPPARTHGDLWGGNVLWSGRRRAQEAAEVSATLIDPSAHGAHGVSDLAMLELFGLPHLERTRSAYAEAADLERGWGELIGLHQLYPLLVHATSHGPAYGAQAEQVARRYA